MARVLVVDNDQGAREMVQEHLFIDNPSWSFQLAGDEHDALGLVQKGLAQGEPIDLIITDLKMTADQSGMQLLTESRRLDPTLMAILVTGREDLLNREHALAIGAFDVIERNLRGPGFVPELKLKARYAIQFREWQRDVALLSRYFDGKVFERIRSEPEVLAMKERLVTIVFWDIRGFTRLCDVLKAKPPLVTGFLKDYCEAAAHVIFEHQGVLDKFIGDGVMALFGVLSDNIDDGEKDALDAILAALAFRGVFDSILKTWLPRWQREVPDRIEIGLGCGINTCRALVGNVGTSFRDQFTAFGDGVNFTARIERRALAGQILLSQSTANRVNRSIQTSPAGSIDNLKNRPGVFDVFAAEFAKTIAAGS